jgi:glycosyltransferase involved in cell wall biosynthesis
VLTVIVPAHNEGRVIGRLLERLVPATEHGELDILVVANGCTDDTAEVAAAFGPPVRLLTVPVPSKREALVAGNEAATGFPRVYLDADVELGADDIWALARALDAPGVLAVAPTREMELTRSAWPVRCYYDIWARLPGVQAGLFGRGVIAVSEEGCKRLSELPPLLADDLAASLAFAPDERAVAADARVVVHAPRTVGDLMRRRIRVVTGVGQIERSADAPESSQRTSSRDLLAIVRSNPGLVQRTVILQRMVIFLAVTIAARVHGNRAAQRNDYTTWLRDESSRG